MRAIKTVLILLILLSTLIIIIVSLHSLQEIHYLKGFYPGNFTMEDAFYASWVELIKTHIISLPLVLIIFICFYLLWLAGKER